jgi:hypothetical protein
VSRGLPGNHLSAREWVEQFHRLLTRSGGLCEARTVDCLAPGGRLDALPRERVSVQHRRAQGAGGTSLAEANNLANLLIFCGTGTVGCHGWVETQERDLARRWGLMVDHTYDDDGRPVPVEYYPVRIGGGRWRALDPVVPLYVELPLTVQWQTDMPTLARLNQLGVPFI